MERRTFLKGMVVAAGGVVFRPADTCTEMEKFTQTCKEPQPSQDWRTQRPQQNSRGSTESAFGMPEMPEISDDVPGVLEMKRSGVYEQIPQIVILEEGLFRAVPAFIVSAKDGGNAVIETIRGGAEFTRREVMVGIATSVLFGLAHMDENTASHSIFGGVMWLVQRRLGYPINCALHILNNHLVLSSQRSK